MTRLQADAFCGSPESAYHRVSKIIPWVIFGITAVLLAALWRTIPAEIPTHYDYAGNVTDSGPKGTLLVLLGLFALMNLLMLVIWRFPRSWNLGVRVTPENRVRVYRLARDMMGDTSIAVAVIFGVMTISTALCMDVGATPLAVGVIALIAIPLLRFYGRVFLMRKGF